SRETFLACLRAQCAPGVAEGPLPAAHLAPSTSSESSPPVPEVDTAAAVLLSLLDGEVVLAVHGEGPGAEALTTMAAAVCRATGARPGPVEEADVVLVHEDPAGAFAVAHRGTSMTPERGATVVLVGGHGSTLVDLVGPGVPEVRTVTLPLTPSALDTLHEVNAAYPCGVDLLLVSGRTVTALPRSVTARPAAQPTPGLPTEQRVGS
uniref:phosphonate C-P lyase system protein PhnH n=1 Tax=Actinotalea sp. C106 TaxID=2908644 RepID=UPI002027F115